MTTPNYAVDPARIDRNWRAITIELDAPRPGRIERMMRRFGLPAHLTRLLVATPALRRAWFVATGLAVVAGLGATDAAQPRDKLFTLLLLAPLVPVLGVSLAYGAEADPAHEAAVATPLSGLRLILTRAAVVLGVSILVLGSATLLTPSVSPMAFSWLVPSFGLTMATVALMTFTSSRRAAVVSGVSWVVLVVLARGAVSDPLAAFEIGGQVLMGTLAGLASAVAYLRRDRFDVLGTGS